MPTGLNALLLLALAAGTAAPGGRVALGQYGRWGAFRDRVPARCYAIAEPAGGDDGGAFVTVASRPGGPRGRVQVRLRRAATAAMAIVGERSVPLAVTGRDAMPIDARGARWLTAALRSGDVLAIVARDARGRRSRDLYPLAGAASAIDAMRIACLQD